MKCNTCQNEDYCYDGNHEITRYGCTDNGFAAYVPQTNADRIRGMTDDELAFYIVNHPMWSDESACVAWLKESISGVENENLN